MESISYRYEKAGNIKQTFTYPDFMCSYDMMITIHSTPQALDVWSRIRSELDNTILESFADFNHAVLRSIEAHKMAWPPNTQPQSTKRGRTNTSCEEPTVKRIKLETIPKRCRLQFDEGAPPLAKRAKFFAAHTIR